MAKTQGMDEEEKATLRKVLVVDKNGVVRKKPRTKVR